MAAVGTHPVRFDVPGVGVLDADFTVVTPGGPAVVFAHGSGSGRHSPRNQAVARRLHQTGVSTLLLDLLTAEEEERELRGGRLRFDVDQLANRLIAAVDWLDGQSQRRPATVGYFGASTGAAGALVAAVRQAGRIAAVVSRGGRPDLAQDLLPLVEVPTLLIVGELDPVVREMNAQAYAQLRCEKQLDVVPGATHLFEEPGTLDQVAELAAGWFGRWLNPGYSG